MYRLEFLAHWDQIPLYIDDYPYSGMSYCGDPNVPLPLGRVWGPDGNRQIANIFMCIVKFQNIVYGIDSSTFGM